MTQHSTSSVSSEQGDYKKVSESQTELLGALPRANGDWSAYWDSYAQEVVELPSRYGHEHCGVRT